MKGSQYQIERLEQLIREGEAVLERYNMRGNIDQHDLWITEVRGFLVINAPEFLESLSSVTSRFRERLILEPYGRASFELIQTQIEILRLVKGTLEGALEAPIQDETCEYSSSARDWTTSYIELRQNIADRFNKDELRTLCFDLKINYENLPDTLSGLIQELILYCKRHNRLTELAERCSISHPDINWNQLLEVGQDSAL